MIEVKTYLGSISATRGNSLVALDDFDGAIDDPIHINGAIELVIAGKRLITLEMWDLVDQLWSYILTGLEAALEGRRHCCYFPDQPIKLTIRPLQFRKYIEISVTADAATCVASMATRTLVLVLSDEAKHCFQVLSRILGKPNYYVSQLAAIDRLRAHASQLPDVK